MLTESRHYISWKRRPANKWLFAQISSSSWFCMFNPDYHKQQTALGVEIKYMESSASLFPVDTFKPSLVTELKLNEFARNTSNTTWNIELIGSSKIDLRNDDEEVHLLKERQFSSQYTFCNTKLAKQSVINTVCSGIDMGFQGLKKQTAHILNKYSLSFLTICSFTG